MRIRFTHPAVSWALAAVLVVTACSAAATPVPTKAPTAAPTSAGTPPPPTATPLPGSKKFIVAFTSRGISSVAMMEATEVLNKAGYSIDTPEIAQSNLIVEGIVNGQFQVTSGTTLSFLIAAQKGGSIRMIGNRLNNEWTLSGLASIQKCDDINGKIFAHHTESAVSTAMSRIWVKANCAATTKFTEVFIQGSDIRAAALRNGQIDITELELGDAFNTTTGALASKFRIVSNFSAALPQLKTSMIGANSQWMAANPGDVLALIRETTIQNRKINADPTGAYLKSLALKWVPKAINPDTIDVVAKAYVEKKLFPGDGGAAVVDIEYTIKFFEDGGALVKGLTVPLAADLTFLNVILKELGPVK
ncbi:MAG: hypothetical protein EXR69_13925 [Myxococcales bacterium]|nr:hypothetical protein [Myxococcales bacterium]